MIDFIASLKERLSRPLPGADPGGLIKPKLPDGSKLELKSQPNPRKGAVLILFYPGGNGVHFPLIQRPNYNGVHGGQIGLPGGKIEDSDKDLYSTALRESHEEIGVAPGKVNIVGNISEFYVAASNHLVLPVIGYTDEKPKFVPDHIEVAEVIEAPLDQLLDPANLKEKEMNIRGLKMRTPYFDINNKVVWGATAMMLSELQAIIKEL